MRNISLDFSTKTDLRWLSDLMAVFHEAAGDTPLLLVGATVRDLLLEQAHAIRLLRATDDVDIACIAETWDAFLALRGRLLTSGRFTEVPGILHRVLYRDGRRLDLVPFGGVENPDRLIAWPPDGATVVDVFGFQEVLAAAIEFVLPGGVSVRAPSLAGLALTKLVAWEDRRNRVPGKDAYDLAVILQHYLPAGNEERLFTEAAHLLDERDFDYELAGAWLLGHDMAALLPTDHRPRIAQLLAKEADPDGPLRLVGDMMPTKPDLSLTLLQAVTRGFREG